MEVIKDIAAIIGLVLSIISLLTLCTKGGRALIKGIFAHNTKEIREINSQQEKDIQSIKESLDKVVCSLDILQEFSIQQCRDTLKNIYYRYHKQKQIPLFERKTADKTYAIYDKKFHANSYGKLLYDEICKWEIIAMSPEDIVEE